MSLTPQDRYHHASEQWNGDEARCKQTNTGHEAPYCGEERSCAGWLSHTHYTMIERSYQVGDADLVEAGMTLD
jgi:hypothetical protein